MIVVNQALLDLFRARRIYHRFGGGERWRVGERLHVDPACRLEPFSHLLGGFALPAALGAFSYSRSELAPSARIGRYCSIAQDLEFMDAHHPAEWVTTSPFSYSPYGLEGFSSYLIEERRLTSFVLHAARQFFPGPVTIGHDVWVGQGAMLKGGVTIGNGAVIAARALVTHDVAPYAVVGGAPARTIRMRFPEPLVERLLALEWWRFGPDVLQPLDVRDPADFVSRLEYRIAQDPPEALAYPPLVYEEIQAAAAQG